MVHISRKVIIGAALLGVAIVGYVSYTKVFASKEPEASSQPVAVTRGNLGLTVSSTGTVKSLRASDLSFRSSGVVEDVYVQIGDSVKKGQPLAKLEPRSLEVQLSQAEIALRTAQLNLETLISGARPEDIASATASLASARQKLATLEAQGLPEEVAAAEASLKSAQSKLAQLNNPTSANEAAARAAVESARGNLLNAQNKLDQLKQPTAADLAAAEGAVNAARTSLEKLKNPSAADIASAQAAVESARTNLHNAQIKLDQLKNPPQEQVVEARVVVTTAETNLGNAQANLEQLKTTLNDEKRRRLVESYVQLYLAREKLAVDRARNASQEQLAADEQAVLLALRAVEDAEKEVDFPKAGVTAQQWRAAEAAITNAQNSLENARIKLDKLLNPPRTDVIAVENAVSSAQASLKSAEAKLNQLLHPSSYDLSVAESNLNSAQAKLDQLRNPAASDIAAAEVAVAIAQANLRSAQAKLEELLNPSAADLAAATSAVLQGQSQLEKTRVPYKEADLANQRASVEGALAQLSKISTPGTALDIAKAQLSIDRARLDVEQARFNLDQAVLVAPFDGVIGKVSVTPGVSQGIGASTVVMSIVDPSVIQVEVNVDETDIAKVELKQTVLVTVEALGSRPYRGKVIAIAPNATVQSGVTMYLITLSVQEPRGLKPGMTAVANIVYDQRQNVLLIPNRAIKTVGRERTVQVLVNGKPETRTIKAGLSGDQRTEVLEGLQEGDQVLAEAGRSGLQSGSSQVPRGAFPGGVGGAVPGGGFRPSGGGR